LSRTLGLIAERCIGALGSIFGASIVTFICLRLLPGDPARLVLGPFAPQEDVDAYSERLGLKEPIFQQYWTYISDFLRGEWGRSFTTGQPVSEQLVDRLPASVELGIAAFLLAALAAGLLALMTTYRSRPWLDRAVSATANIGLGTPAFWLGLVLVLAFARGLDLLPIPNGQLGRREPPPELTRLVVVDTLLDADLAGFWTAIKYLILPTITLALAPFGVLVRLLRANLREVSRESFLLVGRAKGLGARTNYVRHALPNALLPSMTVGGLIFGQLLAGSVLVEVVFNWPGVGALVVDSVQRQDFAVAQAFVILSAVFFVIVNLIVDIAQSLIDPRLRLESSIGRG